MLLAFLGVTKQHSTQMCTRKKGVDLKTRTERSLLFIVFGWTTRKSKIIQIIKIAMDLLAQLFFETSCHFMWMSQLVIEPFSNHKAFISCLCNFPFSTHCLNTIFNPLRLQWTMYSLQTHFWSNRKQRSVLFVDYNFSYCQCNCNREVHFSCSSIFATTSCNILLTGTEQLHRSVTIQPARLINVNIKLQYHIFSAFLLMMEHNQFGQNHQTFAQNAKMKQPCSTYETVK